MLTALPSAKSTSEEPGRGQHQAAENRPGAEKRKHDSDPAVEELSAAPIKKSITLAAKETIASAPDGQGLSVSDLRQRKKSPGDRVVNVSRHINEFVAKYGTECGSVPSHNRL